MNQEWRTLSAETLAAVADRTVPGKLVEYPDGIVVASIRPRFDGHRMTGEYVVDCAIHGCWTYPSYPAAVEAHGSCGLRESAPLARKPVPPKSRRSAL